MAVPEAANPIGQCTNAIAWLLATDMREDLLTIVREIFERKAFAERLAYSPDEAAELLGISRELVHDLLRTGQLGSVKAGRRRLIAKRHLKRSWRASGEATAACQVLHIGDGLALAMIQRASRDPRRYAAAATVYRGIYEGTNARYGSAGAYDTPERALEVNGEADGTPLRSSAHTSAGAGLRGAGPGDKSPCRWRSWGT